MRTVLIALAVTTMLAVPGFAPAQASPEGRRSVRVKVRFKKRRARAGDVVALAVKVRNRTRETQETSLALRFEGSADTPFHEETLELAPRERRRLEVPCVLPEASESGRVEVVARLQEGEGQEDDDDHARIRVSGTVAGPEPDASLGRDLYLASCSSCHGESGDGRIRGEDLSGWWEAVREGEDGMPSFPSLTFDDVRAMREYVLGEVSEPDPEPDPEWSRGRELYLASCAACHGERGDREIRGEGFEDWWEAIREGEDDMPAFPNLSRDDVRAMREYVLDPDREPAPPPPPPPPPGDTPTYESQVRTVLETSCTACHGAGSAQAGVRLDGYDQAFANRSALVDSVEKGRMPPGGSLSAQVKAVLRSWLDAGAPEK